MEVSPHDLDLPPKPVAVIGSHKARVFLQRGLQKTKLGVAEPLESLVIISVALSFPSSPSLSTSVNLSITLHGGMTKTSVSPRSTCRHLCPSTPSKCLIRCKLLLSLVYLKSVCVFSSHARSLISCMNLFFPIASGLF